MSERPAPKRYSILAWIQSQTAFTWGCPPGHRAKLLPGEVDQFVRVAIAAGQRVPDQLDGHLAHRHRPVVGLVMVVRDGGDEDEGVVADLVDAGLEHHAVDDVPVRILEFLAG